MVAQVGKDRIALQLVAHAYLSKVTGTPCDTPFGLTAYSRPRRAQQPEQQRPGAWLGESRTAVAELVQSLAAAGKAPAAGPGTPALDAGAASTVAEEPAATGSAVLVGVPTPAGRSSSRSPPAGVRQPARRALDMLGAGTAAAAPLPAQRLAACRTLQFSSSSTTNCLNDLPHQRSAAVATSSKSPAHLQVSP